MVLGRWLFSLVVVSATVVVVYQLFESNTHFLVIAGFSAVCGGLAGRAMLLRRGLTIGMLSGFLAPLIYIPLWFVFDLPPYFSSLD